MFLGEFDHPFGEWCYVHTSDGRKLRVPWGNLVTQHQIKHRADYKYRMAEEMQEPLIYLGRKRVYGGMNGSAAKFDNAHHFVRPSGRRIYIYGHHIKYITPFT